MENKNRPQMYELNLFACIAIVAIAIALIGKAYFDFRAREREAETARRTSEMIGQAMKAQSDYWKNLPKMNQEIDRAFNQPSSPNASPNSAAPDGEPPPQLPKYGTP